MFDYDADIDRQVARQIADRLRQPGWTDPADIDTDRRNLQNLDIISIEHETPRSTGAELICL